MATAGFQIDGTDATVIDMEGAIDQITQLVSAGASPPTEKLVRALWGVGSLTLVLDVSAGLNQPAMGPVFGGHKIAYYGTLAGILGVVALEMATAYWLPCAGAQLASFAKALLRFAVLLLLLVVAVGGYGLTVKT
uniref:Uncharacterized protein n=1 Tax=Avena sativa TaxID=4498 RepID=A0ACD5TSZ0_AVESA